MMKTKILAILLVFAIFLPFSAAAYEEIDIEYRQADIGDINRYWYGMGEITVNEPEVFFTLYTSDNEIVSFSSNASLISLTEEEIKFNSKNKRDDFSALFLSEKPSGHGVFTLEFSVPHISTSTNKSITLKIENAERIIYLNGPVYFEGTNIRSEGNYKIISVDDPEKDIKLIFVTKLAYGILTSLIGVALFAFSLTVLIILRRKTVVSNIKEKVPAYIKKIPITIYEDEGIELKFRKRSMPSIKKEITTDESGETYQVTRFRFPRELFATIFILMLFYIMLISALNTLSGYMEQMGMFAYIVSGMIFLIGLLMIVLLISVEDHSDLNSIMAVFVGGFILVMFSRAGLVVIPVAIVIATLVYGFNKTVNQGEKQRSDR